MVTHITCEVDMCHFCLNFSCLPSFQFINFFPEWVLITTRTKDLLLDNSPQTMASLAYWFEMRWCLEVMSVKQKAFPDLLLVTLGLSPLFMTSQTPPPPFRR